LGDFRKLARQGKVDEDEARATSRQIDDYNRAIPLGWLEAFGKTAQR
jgi:hypothetical protein